MLLTVGDLLEEVLVQLPAEPARGDVSHVRSARVRGGSAANVAAITAERGGQSRFAGQVGADSIGRVLAEDLRRRGVDTRVRHDGGTGVVVTLAGGGARTRLVDRGTSVRYEGEPDLLDGVSQLYVPGEALMLDPLAGVVLDLAGRAGAAGLGVVVGCPPTTDLVAYGADAFVDLVAMLRPDAVVADGDDFRCLDVDDGAPLPGAQATIVTHGAEPTTVVNDRGLDGSVAVHPVEQIRDRTGAGDGFVAGFLEAKRSGRDPIAAVESGHTVAAAVLRNLGPTTIG